MARRLSGWKIVGLVMATVIFVVGLVTVGRVAISAMSRNKAAKQAKMGVITEVTKAKFDYLAPGDDTAWQYNNQSLLFDQSRGVIKYEVKLTSGGRNVTISQQKMPDDLKPADGAKFKQFVLSLNVTRSLKVGTGTIYYESAILNNAPASGATKVIYATDDVLLFGTCESIVDFDTWAKLVGSMKKDSSN